MNKDELRKKYLNIRHNIVNKDIKTHNIIYKLINLDEFKKANIIGIYYSTGDEVNTKEFIDYLINSGKTVCIPKVIDSSNMEFYEIKNRFNLKKSNFNIYEPTTTSIINPVDIDLIIVPGVVFSKSLYRIGYGMGYYDRYLLKTNAYKVGITFKETLVDELPHDEYDVKMDCVIAD